MRQLRSPKYFIILFLALLCPVISEAAPTITVSGNSVSILGSAQTISLTCTLIDPNQTGNLHSGSNIITVFVTSTVTPGNVATCGPIYGNDVILDGYGNANTTYYKVQVFTVSNGIVASTPSLQQFYAFTGNGTVDLATATPLAPSFFTGPSGNVSMPGSLAVTGTESDAGGTHSGLETLTGGLTGSQAGTFTGGPNLYHQFLLNNCNPGTEFQNFQASSALTEVLTACSTVPNGGTLTQSNALGAYTVGNAGNSIGQVALYGQARGNSANARVWGLNAVVFDTAGNASPNLFAAELDAEVVNAGSSAFGANIVGLFKAQPTGGAGVLVTTTQISPCTTCAWPFGVRISTGATLAPALGQGAIYLFPQATGNSQPSQGIVLQSTTGGGGSQVGIETFTAAGNFNFATPGSTGVSINSGTPLQTSNQSGTGSICMTTNCGLTTPTLTGITNGTGLQLFNSTTTCTTGASVGATCTTGAITLPVGYSDTNYRASCTGQGPTNVPIVETYTKSNTTFTITIAALTAAAASFTSYDCIVGHN